MPDLPPPLPPEQRTIGQLIAESIRAYGGAFLAALPLGVPFAVVEQVNLHHPSIGVQMIVYWLAAPFFVAAFLYAIHLVLDASPSRSAVLVALLVYAPFPVLRAGFVLPGLAWFAFIGLAVPAAAVEKLGLRDALVRGRRLGTADYVHALGSLVALVVVVIVSELTLVALLRTQGDSGQRVAAFLADVVLSPLFFLGSALLYVDQAARVGSGRPHRRSRRDADLHPPVDAEPAGHSDPQVEP